MLKNECDINSSFELLHPKKKYQWPLLRNKFPSLKLISAGSHCLDIMPASADDPKWLTAQRNKTVEVIKWWFHKYYNDLRRFA